ncbi:P-loop containing nucleoside triphosphate hydrolase protein [Metschnikowia bicuspidata var. bicuspidata NRRL YB-4993]|uniref:ATP-dependent DNA helicase n=1 Tax=Metschnikowia bicuspidata var. bicuspidata NRRL YB-4993 TaxID=869754 RepID=A0A1A0HDA8_9ASCO|nr:P-loop containing nucleoside triphosphate hydrolase protein [Metschnikowia bicuspidata var. bicuspidata NRRL YB-4993]OBA22001.1 P-loop containing nucleoside triphosphate hydrolase protein [Metschnikowia bicuspidata var. bicuspidata NRRL YB-4993]
MASVQRVPDELDDELDPLVLEVHTLRSPPPHPAGPPAPLRHRVDPHALDTYVYPTNLQVRDYQYNIVRQAFFHNTLVVLPTGLGKTFVASTVILNFWRWFPELKIVFMAPTRPLVAQQIKACCGVTGLPPLQMAILLDLTRRNRAQIWASKRVFFTTPQVVENDLKLGSVDPRLISLVVIDEAHRAKGNYAYHNVVRFMDRFHRHYRILAMTATPASSVDGVQEIIDNLHISRAEVRTERSIDIVRHLKHKTVQRIRAEPSDDVRYAIGCVCSAIAPILKQANDKRIYDVTDPALINAFTAMDALRRLVANKAINDGVKWAGHSLLQVLGVAGQCLRRLNIYGVRLFYSYFKDKHADSLAKTAKLRKPTAASRFMHHPQIAQLMAFCHQRVADAAYLGHEKLEIVVAEVRRFFESTTNLDSRVIIFSEFREAALDIVRALEQLGPGLRPHIFIGQSKDTKSEDARLAGPRTKAARKSARDQAAHSGLASSELAQLTGMSQKMQKETIRSFKDGVYNVLVATSIGEEGLDIGEVDLIVCYDSTSSPIKNVQRMGRTGRSRDGKVLLLFSGNEEAKFDRAMGGYEYIQQHIMNGNLILLHEQNRLIPDGFSLTVDERFIEIPVENNAIREEADDDEIIKIATKYMTGSKPAAKAKPSTTRAKKTPLKTPHISPGRDKVQKRFFMPDNVTTGFQLVSAMMRQATEESAEGTGISAAKRAKLEDNKERDILDLFLDSEEDHSDAPESLSCAPLPQQTTGLEDNPNADHETKAPAIDSPNEAPKTEALARHSPSVCSRTSSTFLRQPQLDSLLSLQKSSRSSSPLLGVKRRPPSVLEQLKAQACQTQSRLHAAPEVKQETSDNDDFSDDDEILALVRRTHWPIQARASFPEFSLG